MRAGAEAALTLDLPDIGKLGATITAFASYDLTKASFADAFKAEINVVLDDEFKRFLAEKGEADGDLSPILKLAAESDSLNVICANGKVVFVIMKGGERVYAKNLTPEEYDFGTDPLTDELVDLIGETFVYPVADVGATKSDDGKTVSVYVNAYNVNIAQGDEFIPDEDYETFEMVRLDIKFRSAVHYVFGWNIDEIYAEAVAAGETIETPEELRFN